MTRTARFSCFGLVIAIGFSLVALPALAAEEQTTPQAVEALRSTAEGQKTYAQLESLASGERGAKKQEEVIGELYGEYQTLRQMGLSDADAWKALVASRQKVQAEEKKTKEEAAEKQFLGLRWGLGVALSVDLQGGHRVGSAKIVDGVVRVEEENDATPRIFLEMHNFRNKNDDGTPAMFGHGLFVGIQSSKEEVLDSFAMGYMWGWREDPAKTSSFNVGVGLVVDPKVQVLGDGLRANHQTTETTIRLKKESRLGALVVASFNF